MEFTVKVVDGEVFVDGKFIAQLCWDATAIGNAITQYLEEREKDGEAD